MKSFSTKTLLLFFSLFTLSLYSEDKKSSYNYEGKITGLYCSACAAKVKAALSQLEGVTKVKITNSKEIGVQKIYVESSSTKITKDTAIKALGEDAKSFTILSLAPAN